METFLYKLLTKDKQARIYLVDNTFLLNELEAYDFKSDIASDVFYTVMTFCCILRGIMTNAKRITIKLETSDASAFLICGAEANGNIQGYASDVLRENDFADLKSMIGTSGCLKIIRDNGQGTIFTGIVEIQCNNISNNLAHYFTQSEQTKTTFRYFQNIQNAMLSLSRGVLIQALPFAESTLMTEWENRIESDAQAFTDPHISLDKLVETVFSDADVVERFPVRLMCTCSKEMILETLLGLGASDLQWTLKENQNIEVRCNKCGKIYGFDADEIQRLLL